MSKPTAPSDIWEMFSEMDSRLAFINDMAEEYMNNRAAKYNHDAYMEMIFDSPQFRYVCDELRYIEKMMREEIGLTPTDN